MLLKPNIGQLFEVLLFGFAAVGIGAPLILWPARILMPDHLLEFPSPPWDVVWLLVLTVIFGVPLFLLSYAWERRLTLDVGPFGVTRRGSNGRIIFSYSWRDISYVYFQGCSMIIRSQRSCKHVITYIDTSVARSQVPPEKLLGLGNAFVVGRRFSLRSPKNVK